MKSVLPLIVPVIVVFMLLAYPLVCAGEKEVKRVEASTEVLSQIMAIPEQSIPPAILSNAKGVAVLPGVVKVGFTLGGKGGYGILSVRNEEGAFFFNSRGI